MADVIKVLAQLYPAANVESVLYTCGAANGTVISSIIICNSDSGPDTLTVRICVAGTGNDPKQLFYSGAIILGNATIAGTLGLTLAMGDVIKVTSLNGTSAFQIFGQENN